MKTKIILIVTLLFLSASVNAYSQTEASGDEKMAAGKYADALADYTKQWATSDTIGRERLVGKMASVLAKLDKAPVIPDDAEFHYAKGVAFIRLAKTPADAANFTKAREEFGAAINLAPWVFDYWYNWAVAGKSAGNFASASVGVKFAKTLAQNDKDRRDALTLRAEIEAAQEMADAAKAAADKAERARQQEANSPSGQAKAMLAILQNKYAGTVTKLLICGIGIKSNPYWQCSDEEARGSNWVDSTTTNAQPPPGRGTVRYRIVGPDADLIEIKLGDYGWGGDAYRSGCGRPNGNDPNAITWGTCRGSAEQMKTYQMKVLFMTSSSGSPLIEVRESCGGKLGADSCRRAQFTL